MVASRAQNINLQRYLITVWYWSEKCGLLINPGRYSYLTIGQEVPQSLYFSPIAMSKLVKDLGIQRYNAFSPSGQCINDANEPSLLIFMIRRFFQDLLKLTFLPLCGALMCPQLEKGMPACSQIPLPIIIFLEWIQRLTKRLITGIRHLPYKNRLQRLGLHSLQRRRLRADLITAFKIFTDIDPNLFFSLPLDTTLEGTHDKSPHRRRGLSFSVRVVEFWNKPPGFCHCFHEKVGESFDSGIRPPTPPPYSIR